MTIRRTRRAVLGGAAALAGALAGCLGRSGTARSTATDDTETAPPTTRTATEGIESEAAAMDTETPTEAMSTETLTPTPTPTESSPGGWQTRTLTDVLTDEMFAIAEFETPIVLEFFAVWCPICTSQQRELAALREELGDAVTVVSLNIDPNEDAGIIRRHAAEHGFGWRYAVAPTTMTWALTDEFGPSITSAPTAPVVVVCPDGDATRLSERGVKPAGIIENQIAGC